MDLKRCRCGCVPITGNGCRDGLWVVFVVCRMPERHSNDWRNVVTFKRSLPEAEAEAEGIWNKLFEKEIVN